MVVTTRGWLKLPAAKGRSSATPATASTPRSAAYSSIAGEGSTPNPNPQRRGEAGTAHTDLQPLTFPGYEGTQSERLREVGRPVLVEPGLAALMLMIGLEGCRLRHRKAPPAGHRETAGCPGEAPEGSAGQRVVAQQQLAPREGPAATLFPDSAHCHPFLPCWRPAPRPFPGPSRAQHRNPARWRC